MPLAPFGRVYSAQRTYAGADAPAPITTLYVWPDSRPVTFSVTVVQSMTRLEADTVWVSVAPTTRKVGRPVSRSITVCTAPSVTMMVPPAAAIVVLKFKAMCISSAVPVAVLVCRIGAMGGVEEAGV